MFRNHIKKLHSNIVFLLFPLLVFSQNPDSLLKALNLATEDSIRVKILSKLQDFYASGNQDSALLFIRQEDSLAKKLNNAKFIAEANVGYMEYYLHKNQYQKAKDFAFKNIDIANATKDKVLLSKTYSNLSFIYKRSMQYKQAIEYVLKSINLSYEIGDTQNLCRRYVNLSMLYVDVPLYSQAINYGLKAIEIAKRNNISRDMLLALNNTAVAYATVFKLDSAIILLKEELVLAQQLGMPRDAFAAAVNICVDEYMLGHLNKIAPYATIVNESIKKLGADVDDELVTFQQAANALNEVARNNLPAAEAFATKAIEVGERAKSTDALMNAYDITSKIAYLQNNITKGELFAFRADSLKDAEFNNELTQYAISLNEQFETEKKDNRIQLQNAALKQKSMLNYFFAGLTLASLLIIILLLLNYKKRQTIQQQKINELETEKTLTASKSLLEGEEKERTRIAKDLHDGLSGMLSGVKYSLQNMQGNLIMTPDNQLSFARSMDMLDNSINEMRRVAQNMMPEALVQFGLDLALKDFASEINRTGMIKTIYESMGLEQKRIDQTTSIAVYRIIQELVNNTIKHAHAQQVFIQLLLEEKKLIINVDDNGCGFDKASLQRNSGMGWKNIVTRIEYLKGRIDVKTEPGKGTAVNIELTLAA